MVPAPSPPPHHRPSATTFSSVEIVPFATQSVASTLTADVLVKLQADVPIWHYYRYYDTPLESFQPKYYALNDGTLLSGKYVAGLKLSRLWLFIAGALFAFFLRNTFSALSYIRRSKVKDKTLFYLLFVAQVLGLASAIVMTIGNFDQSIECMAVSVLTKVFTKLSCDTMITGIFGVKAYRCLGNSRWIIAFLAASGAVMLVLLGLELSGNHDQRDVYGACVPSHDMRILSAMITATFAETAVLCGCFCYTIWKSYRIHREARLTIRTSEEGCESSSRGQARPGEDAFQSRRGWWDYTPAAQTASVDNRRSISFSGVMETLRAKMRRFWHGEEFPPSIAYQRKSSLPGEHPIPQPPRPSVHTEPSRLSTRVIESVAQSVAAACRSCILSPVRTMRKLIRTFSHMELFRRVLRNELLYTTFLAIIFLVFSVIMLVGSNESFLLRAEGWVLVNWIVIAMFTMHGFNRVVHRHELEAVLQHPAAWDRMLHSDADYGDVFFQKPSTHSNTPRVTADHLRVRHRDDPSDDTHASILTSLDKYDDDAVPSLTTHPRLSRQSLYEDFDKPFASTPASLPSFHTVRPPSPVDFTRRPYSWDAAVISPFFQLPHDREDDEDVRPSTAPADLRTHDAASGSTFVSDLRTTPERTDIADNHFSVCTS